MDAVVECYSGYIYPERPKVFYWDQVRYEVESIAAEWRDLDGKHFQVITRKGMAFELVYEEDGEQWRIVCETVSG